MSSQFEDSVSYVFIITAAHGLADTNGEAALAAGGGCFFIDGYGAEVDTVLSTQGSTADIWFAAKRADGTIMRSPRCKWANMVEKYSNVYIAPVEQESFLGYNGVSGSMDSTLGYYSLSVVLDHTFGLLNNSPLIKTVPYKLATATQSALTIGLVDAGYTAFSRDPHRDVQFEAICNTAVDANYDITNDTIIVNGSKVINVANNLTYNTAAGTLVVGDFIRIADDSLNGTLALTDPVYRVEEINTLAVTLDRPVDVPSGTWTDAGDGIQVITAAQALAANWGIRFQGSTPCTTSANFNPITDTPFQVNFKVTSDDFSTATMTYSTTPFIGNGTYPLVSFDEYQSQFERRNRHVQAYPPAPNYTFQAATGLTYNTIDFSGSDSAYVSATTGINPKSKFRVKIYYYKDAGAVDTVWGTDKTVLGSTAITAI